MENYHRVREHSYTLHQKVPTSRKISQIEFTPSHMIPKNGNVLVIYQYFIGLTSLCVFGLSSNQNQEDKEFLRKIEPEIIKAVRVQHVNENPSSGISFRKSIERSKSIKVLKQIQIFNLTYLQAKNLMLWLVQFAPIFFKTHRLECQSCISVYLYNYIMFNRMFYQTNFGWNINSVSQFMKMIENQLPKYQFILAPRDNPMGEYDELWIWYYEQNLQFPKMMMLRQYLSYILKLPIVIIDNIIFHLGTLNSNFLYSHLLKKWIEYIEKKPKTMMSPFEMFDYVYIYISCFPNHPFKSQKYEYDDPNKELNLKYETILKLDIKSENLCINIYQSI